MKKIALTLCLLFIGASFLFTQELGVWRQYQLTDRFGDPTGYSYWGQGVRGEGISSGGNSSPQVVAIAYPEISNRIEISLKDLGILGIPLRMLYFGLQPSIILYIKDSANNTYAFEGVHVSSDGGIMDILMDNDSGLLDLLRKSGSYKAVIEGDDWSCSFTFNGGMP